MSKDYVMLPAGRYRDDIDAMEPYIPNGSPEEMTTVTQDDVGSPWEGFTGWKRAYLRRLAQTANVRLSCRAAGKTRTAVNAQRKKDEAFDMACEDAMEDALDQVEYMAFKAAVIGGSESMIKFLLSAHRQKYKPKEFGSGAGEGEVEIVEKVTVGKPAIEKTA